MERNDATTMLKRRGMREKERASQNKTKAEDLVSRVVQREREMGEYSKYSISPIFFFN